MKLTIEHVLELIEVLPTDKVFDYVSGGDSKAKLISVDKQNLKVDIARVNADGTEKITSFRMSTVDGWHWFYEMNRAASAQYGS